MALFAALLMRLWNSHIQRQASAFLLLHLSFRNTYFRAGRWAVPASETELILWKTWDSETRKEEL